jgi:hypothetical protein
MKYRHGCIWNAKLAKRIGRQYKCCRHAKPHPSAKAPCPLCGLEDSGGHIMGDCRHKHMQGLTIQRHNDAVQTIAKALRKSAHMGDGLTWMDAGDHNVD